MKLEKRDLKLKKELLGYEEEVLENWNGLCSTDEELNKLDTGDSLWEINTQFKVNSENLIVVVEWI